MVALDYFGTMVPTILTVTRIATVVDWDDASYTIICPLHATVSYLCMGKYKALERWQTAAIPDNLNIASQV